MNKKVQVFFLYFFLLFFILIGVIPIILLFILSFSSQWKWPDLLPTIFSIRAWKYILFESKGTVEAIKNSLLIAVMVNIINLVIAIPAADALARYKFKGKGFLELFFMIPIVISPLTILVGMHKSFIKFGLTESILGIVLAHVIPTLPYMIRAVETSYKNLGFKWEEAAKVLGAGTLKKFFYVTLPFILPGIVAGSSLTILISLNQYISTMFIGGGQISTVSIVMFPFISGGEQSIGAAYSILFALVSLICLWIMDSFIKRYYKQ